MANAQFGVIGMAVMGRNLAMNIADQGYTVAVWNREPDTLAEAVAWSDHTLQGYQTLAELVAALERPRKILMMIKAGAPVDAVLSDLTPLLEAGDIVIEGGNSRFEDTQRREQHLREQGLNYFGVGVSGGEEGARHGPSLMPGGDREAYTAIQPILEAIAARSEAGPCVTYIGPDGAGHFTKMVHNGIEYADMQVIAEAYHLLKQAAGLDNAALAKTFAQWNNGVLESFLMDITAKLFTVRDTDGSDLIDQILGKAGQKGTGRWTAELALTLGVPVPSISAAIDARVLSSMYAERQRAADTLTGPSQPSSDPSLIGIIHDALYVAKIAAYAQGMALIRAGSQHYGWDIDLQEIARIWKAGCIIRARFLDEIRAAYERAPELTNLLLDLGFSKHWTARQEALRRVVQEGARRGIPLPGMANSLAYIDSYRSAWLPQNLIQAQRDAFGAHTYQRVDDPEGPFVHTAWLG